MPVEGGFYRWVRAGFGDFWGFLAGWWNWSASFLLGSVYAVAQFADYLGFYFPELTGMAALDRFAGHRSPSSPTSMCVAFNWWGNSPPRWSSFILLPVLVLVVIGLAHWHHNPFCSRGAAASAILPRLRRRSGDWALALFRLRTAFHRRRRSGRPAAQLSSGAGAGCAHVDRRLFPAHAGLARRARPTVSNWHTRYFPTAAPTSLPAPGWARG